jgi:hypothetical protein
MFVHGISTRCPVKQTQSNGGNLDNDWAMEANLGRHGRAPSDHPVGRKSYLNNEPN